MTGVREYPLDELLGKHESGPFYSDDVDCLEVDVAGERVTVLIPTLYPEIKVRRTMRDGDLLLILGDMQARPEEPEDEADGLGAIILARRQPDGVYAAAIWHELWPWTVGQIVGEPKAEG